MNYGDRYFVTKNGVFIKSCWSGIEKRKMEQIVADMQQKDPDSEFKMYSWDGDLIYSLLPIMLDKQVFREENWNWDKKYRTEKENVEEDWDIT